MDVRELGRRWAEAEVKGDVQTLADITTDDFTLAGPAGFVLRKPGWLDRYINGGLVTHALDWRDVEVRDYGMAAVTVGIHEQKAEMGDRNVDGKFRISHFWVRQDDRWLLAGIHLSQLTPQAEAQAMAARD